MATNDAAAAQAAAEAAGQQAQQAAEDAMPTPESAETTVDDDSWEGWQPDGDADSGDADGDSGDN